MTDEERANLIRDALDPDLFTKLYGQQRLLLAEREQFAPCAYDYGEYWCGALKRVHGSGLGHVDHHQYVQKPLPWEITSEAKDGE